jgi:hypothetical protein
VAALARDGTFAALPFAENREDGPKIEIPIRIDMNQQVAFRESPKRVAIGLFPNPRDD